MEYKSINSNFDFAWLYHPTNRLLFESIPNAIAMRFVGGCIRNTLQGTPPKINNHPVDDIDLATSYTPDQIIGFLKKIPDIHVIPTGLKHGTITAILHGQPYEITTLRRDIETDGRHATIEYTDSWYTDAQRRDFTINALYMDHQGQLYDDVGGYNDIMQKKLRFIGDPFLRIKEDALRIVRFFRFWSTFHYAPDENSLQAVCQMKNLLDSLSGERITQEMLKILKQPNPWPIINIMEKKGFMPFLLGTNTHQKKRDELMFLEKETGIFDPWMRLYHMCPAIPSRLVLSNQQKKQFKQMGSLVQWHQAKQYAYDHGVLNTKKRWMLLALENMTEGNNTIMTRLQNVFHDLDHFSFPPFPISGHDIKNMGFEGKKIGRLLTLCRQWWIHQGSFHSRQDCLDYIQDLTRTM